MSFIMNLKRRRILKPKVFVTRVIPTPGPERSVEYCEVDVFLGE